MMKEIIVYADWQGLDEVSRIGFLRIDKVRGEEIFSFEYDDKWIKSGNARYIDPDLKLFAGPQYLSNQKPNFGVFLDSSPDRWGRMLLERKESVLARIDNRPVRRLSESDFLLGLNDFTRMGGLRFKLDENASFLAKQSDFRIPPVTSIRELEQISLKLESDVVFKDEQEQRWIDMLVAPGSSLGGARPKANVIDPEGDLLIAKFPSMNDSIDKGAWEYLAYLIAKESGINISASMANK
jgi:serine/threonine-protein kinase HipA